MSQMKMFACALSVVGLQAVAGAAEPVVFAYEGGDVPGVTGATFVSLNGATVDDDGRVAFPGVFTGSGVTAANNSGIWRGYPDDVQLEIREGQAAAAIGAGVNYGEILQVILNSDGFAFQTRLTGTGVTSSNDEAIFLWDGGSVTLLVRKGDAADGGGVFTEIQLAGVSDSGVLNLSATSDNGGTLMEGFWAGPAGSLVSVLAYGDTAPGLPAGRVIQSQLRFDLNNSGGGYVQGSSGGGKGFLGDGSGSRGGSLIEGFWTWESGVLEKVVVTGDIMPWPSAGAAFMFSVLPTQNDAGDIAFSGFTTAFNPGPWAMWSTSPSGLVLETIAGDAAPGTPGWEIGLPVPTHISPDGVTTFRADLNEPSEKLANPTGIFRVDNGVLEGLMYGPSDGSSLDPSFTEITPDSAYATDSRLTVVDASARQVGESNRVPTLVGINELGEQSLLLAKPEFINVAPQGEPADLRDFTSFFLGFNNSQTGRRFVSESGLVTITFRFDVTAVGLAAVQIPSVCVNDIDGSGSVDLADLSVLLSNFGTSVPRGTLGDVDRNGTVDLRDLNSVLGRFGADCS